jgi:hypothetical protein
MPQSTWQQPDIDQQLAVSVALPSWRASLAEWSVSRERRSPTMRSKMIIATVVALFSLGAVAQASDDRMERRDRDTPRMTSPSATEGRGDRDDRYERGDRDRRERSERLRDRDHDAYERSESRGRHNEADEHRRR